MEPSNQIRVSFGAPSIADQVGVRNSDIDACQVWADAITRLKIAGLLTDSQCHAARHKLIKRIVVSVNKTMVADEQRRAKHEAE